MLNQPKELTTNSEQSIYIWATPNHVTVTILNHSCKTTDFQISETESSYTAGSRSAYRLIPPRDERGCIFENHIQVIGIEDVTQRPVMAFKAVAIIEFRSDNSIPTINEMLEIERFSHEVIQGEFVTKFRDEDFEAGIPSLPLTDEDSTRSALRQSLNASFRPN